VIWREPISVIVITISKKSPLSYFLLSDTTHLHKSLISHVFNKLVGIQQISFHTGVHTQVCFYRTKFLREFYLHFPGSVLCVHTSPQGLSSSIIHHWWVFVFFRWKMFSSSFFSWLCGSWPMEWLIRRSSTHMIPALTGYSGECSIDHTFTFLDKYRWMSWIVSTCFFYLFKKRKISLSNVW